MLKMSPRWMRDGSLAIGFAVGFFVSFYTAQLFWFLPAGVRFVAFLLLPYRSWPVFVLVTEIVFALAEPGYWQREFSQRLWLINAITHALAALGPLWLRKTRWPAPAMTTAAIARLLTAMAMSAALATLAHAIPPLGGVLALSAPRLILQHAFGDYIGILSLVPLAWIGWRDRPSAQMLRAWRFDAMCILLPAFLLYALFVSISRQEQAFFFSALLCCVPVLLFAVRTGWRGAALALTAATVAIAISGRVAGNASLTVEAQAFLAVMGSAALLLGAANDALREQGHQLQLRNVGLVAASGRQERLAVELREAARRNLEIAEDMRRWITAELHDEIGQNLTALQTRVRLLERKIGTQDGSGFTADIDAILAHMRQTVSGLLSGLRPTGLDDFGLQQSLRDGAIRNLVENGGLAWDLRIADADRRLDHLDVGAQTAIYRIVQEAATNAIRHAGATRLCVRVRARAAGAHTGVLVVVADNGHGFVHKRRTNGIGLKGIHDRVLALGGHLHVGSGRTGTRVCARITFTVA